MGNMGNNKSCKCNFLNIIGAVLFLAISAYFIINDIKMLKLWYSADIKNFYNTFLACSAVVAALSYVIVAIMMLMSISKVPLIAGFVASLILNIIACAQYKVYEGNYDCGKVAYLEVICKAEVIAPYNMYLLEVVSLIAVIAYIIVANLKAPKVKKVCKKIWFCDCDSISYAWIMDYKRKRII